MEIRERLEKALRANDERSLSARAERIVWLSSYESLPSAIIGRTETLGLLQEAREVFIQGHYLAVLLVAVSVIEHCLSEELQLRGEIKGKEMLSAILMRAEKSGLLSSAQFLACQQLVSRRNPLAHLKPEDHVHALGFRVVSERRHPQELSEIDARSAIEVMYGVFRATLRPVG